MAISERVVASRTPVRSATFGSGHRSGSHDVGLLVVVRNCHRVPLKHPKSVVFRGFVRDCTDSVHREGLHPVPWATRVDRGAPGATLTIRMEQCKLLSVPPTELLAGRIHVDLRRTASALCMGFTD
jgi:hypothetical protein